jgi:hypothetical protein
MVAGIDSIGKHMGNRMKAVALIVAATSPAAWGGAYKCTDAAGKVTFQQQPCPQDATTSKMKVDAATWVLVGTGNAGGEGKDEYYMDTDTVTPVSDFKRARFKHLQSRTYDDRYNRSGASTRTLENADVYYHYFDCKMHRVSDPVRDTASFEFALRDKQGKGIGYWRDWDRSYYNVEGAAPRVCGG